MKVTIGNMFESNAQTLVNTVNCVGIMGKGIALEFKKRFPEMFKDYKARCDRNEVKPGIPYLYSTLFPPKILNFPTKSHWRAASRIQDVECGLKLFREKYKHWGITSVAMPPLGCGNGQLLWSTVGPMIYHYLHDLDIEIEMFAPYGTPPNQLTEAFLSQAYNYRNAQSGNRISQKMNPAWVALIEIVHRIESEKYHAPVGRTIFQKIAFVATNRGLPTGLQFKRGSYGPYTKELDEVKKRLADAGVLQEKQLGRMLQITPGMEFKEIRKNYITQINQWSHIIEKTVDLFLRLDTEQAEMVATVLYAAHELEDHKKISEKDLLNTIFEWKKDRLNQQDLAQTIRNLGVLNWLQVSASEDLVEIMV